MCGIAGIVSSRPILPGTDILQEMSRQIRHRGPDDQGALRYRHGSLWKGRGLGEGPFELFLLHHRLSIIDLSESGWQPMSTPDDRFHLVFNGEIYNYVELRRELEAQGVAFASTSDTEVLLHACRRWRENVFGRLVGMYAFALFDRDERTVLLARDPFGIKPLYYTQAPVGLAFASEINALLALPGIARTVSPERLFTYLRYGHTDFDGGTMFDRIRQVPAAHYLKVRLDRPDVADLVRHWTPRPGGASGLPFEDAADRLKNLFLESVRLHMRSDVPVGSALSGGLDSTSIVMAMRRLAGNETPLHAFSYLADDPRYDEEGWVDAAVQASQAIAHKFRIHGEELVTDLDRLIRAHAEPFLSTSVYAQYRVFQQAKAHGIKVMLDGQGADEMLCGYPGHQAARLAGLLLRGRVTALVDYVRSLRRQRRSWDILWKAGQFVIPAGVQGPFRRMLGESLVPAWLSGAWFRGRGVEPAPLRDAGTEDPLHREMASTLFTTTLPMLLRFEDRNSMIHSIESRVPFLTVPLAEFLSSLPDDHLIGRDGTTKRVFRSSMQGIVHRALLERKDKIGFATPQAGWLRSVLRHRRGVLADVRLPCFDPSRIDALFRDEAGLPQHSLPMWRILNVHLWAQAFNVSFD